MKKIGTYNNINLYINNGYFPRNIIKISKDSYNYESITNTRKLIYPLTHSIPDPYQMSYIRNYNLI